MTWSWYVNRNQPAAVVPGADEVPTKLDSALEKLVKLFPVEVVTIYTGADQIARAATGDVRPWALLAVAVLGLVLLPGAYARFRGISLSDRQGLVQVVIGIGAYLVWVYAQEALPSAYGVYSAVAAGIAVFIYLGVVLVYGPKQDQS